MPQAESPAAQSEAVPAAGVLREPVPGVDYEVIEISEDMEPAEIRKARIANAKAKSAAMKAFKEAGGQIGQTAEAPVAAPQQAPTSIEPPEEVSGEPPVVAPVAVDVPRPEYIEITDDMSPDELRKARISNSKARSAYNKALKAAGIDPKSVQ